jgi:hypothetical protein
LVQVWFVPAVAHCACAGCGPRARSGTLRH